MVHTRAGDHRMAATREYETKKNNINITYHNLLWFIFDPDFIKLGLILLSYNVVQSRLINRDGEACSRRSI